MPQWIWKTFHQLSLEQLYAVIHLRQQVFVIEQQCLYPDADGFDAASMHCLGYDQQGVLVAYARILPPGVRYAEPSIGRVIVAGQLRARGIGEELMKQTLLQAAALYPDASVRISAQARLERFYRKLGFTRVGELYDDVGIAHIDMLTAKHAGKRLPQLVGLPIS
jgi:ElaA protein